MSDLFTTGRNHKLPINISPVLDPMAWKEDAFHKELSCPTSNAGWNMEISNYVHHILSRNVTHRSVDTFSKGPVVVA